VGVKTGAWRLVVTNDSISFSRDNAGPFPNHTGAFLRCAGRWVACSRGRWETHARALKVPEKLIAEAKEKAK
jgi:hypothetical protein